MTLLPDQPRFTGGAGGGGGFMYGSRPDVESSVPPEESTVSLGVPGEVFSGGPGGGGGADWAANTAAIRALATIKLFLSLNRFLL